MIHDTVTSATDYRVCLWVWRFAGRPRGGRQGVAIPWLEGWTSEKRFRTRRRATDRDQPGGLFPWTPYLTPEPNVSVLEVVIQTVGTPTRLSLIHI